MKMMNKNIWRDNEQSHNRHDIELITKTHSTLSGFCYSYFLNSNEKPGMFFHKSRKDKRFISESAHRINYLTIYCNGHKGFISKD